MGKAYMRTGGKDRVGPVFAVTIVLAGVFLSGLCSSNISLHKKHSLQLEISSIKMQNEGGEDARKMDRGWETLEQAPVNQTKNTFQPAPIPNGTPIPQIKLLPAEFSPVVEAVHVFPHDAVVKTGGGTDIVVEGSGFGDVTTHVEVRIGDTMSEKTSWISDSKILAKIPPGVGGALPVTVTVKEDDREPAVGILDGAFSYTHPFVFDIHPVFAGKPVLGQHSITIKAWGIGQWDTQPEAMLNGQRCMESKWIDNTTIICVTSPSSRVSMQNPEVRVGGQRSTCHVMQPGICTVSAHHGTEENPKHLEDAIRQMESHGQSVTSLKKRLKELREGWYDDNSNANPCKTWEECKPNTWWSAMFSVPIMMGALASMFLLVGVVVYLVVYWGSKGLALLGIDMLEWESPRSDFEVRLSEFFD